MTTTSPAAVSLGDDAARTLANATKSVPQMSTITPRWLTHLLSWVPVEAGIYRLNQVIRPEEVEVQCSNYDEAPLPNTFVDYDPNPREYRLKAVQTILDVHTRISDLYSSPHNQIAQQLRLTIETIKEHQEGELINSLDYGLLASAEPSQRVSTIGGPPTPDDLDNLLRLVWKQPAFFLTHPEGVAAFGRECTRKGTTPPTISMFGSQFLTWRGIPIVPSDKVPIVDRKTKFLLLRVGEARQGIIGLFQPGLAGEQGPGLSVRFMGIDRSAIASYLVSLYCSLVVLTPDALAVLDDVEIDRFHDYAPKYL